MYVSIYNNDQVIIPAKMSRVEARLLAIEKDTHNAFISTDRDAALAKEKECEERLKYNNKISDIDGMVISVKDNIHVAHMPNTAGTPALKHFIPTENAPVVEKLLSAGAICIGKTHMHEMAFGITSYNPTYNKGAFVGVRNAHDHSKVAGGSSGGSAVSVALDMCDISLGSDTGGSVRIPAALNGVVGFRPSTGRYSAEGVTPISSTRDTIGILAKCVADVKVVNRIITEDSPAPVKSDSKIVVGYDEVNSLANCSDDVMSAWSLALETLRKDGRFSLVKIDTSRLQELCKKSGNDIVGHECYRDLAVYLRKYNTGLTVEELVSKIETPTVKVIYTKAFGDNSAAHEVAMKHTRPQLIAEYKEIFTEVDVMIAPSVPITAIDANADFLWANHGELFNLHIQNVNLASLVGAPSVTIPIPSYQLPVGLLLDSQIGEDIHLLAIAQAVEYLMQSIVL